MLGLVYFNLLEQLNLACLSLYISGVLRKIGIYNSLLAFLFWEAGFKIQDKFVLLVFFECLSIDSDFFLQFCLV